MDHATITAKKASLQQQLAQTEQQLAQAQRLVETAAINQQRLQGAIACCDELLAPPASPAPAKKKGRAHG